MIRHRARTGFTLIEMMVVVAIVGVLGSIAWPSVMGAMVRARKTEVHIVRAAIDRSVFDFHLRSGDKFPGDGTFYTEWNPHMNPADMAPPNANLPPAPWDTTSASHENWKQIDFLPEGLLRGRYGIHSYSPGGGEVGNYHVDCVTDLNNNGIPVGYLLSWTTGGTNSGWVIESEALYSFTGIINIGDEI